jgi:WD40 repeat protein
MFDSHRLRPWRAITLAGWLGLSGCASTPSVAPLFSAETGNSPGSGLAFAPQSDQLAAAGTDGRVHLWRLPDGYSTAVWKAHEGSVTGLTFLRDGRLLTTGYNDATLALWSRDGNLLERRAFDSPATALTLAQAQNLFWTGHADGSVRQWRLDTLVPEYVWQRHRSDVRAVAYDAATARIASSGYDGQVYLGRAGEPARALPAPPSDARDLVFLENGRVLVGGGWFKLFRWDIGADRLTVLPTDHHGIIASLALAGDGRTLASISRQTDSAVRLIDASTGATLKYFATHELCGTHVRLSPNGRYLASSADDASVYLFAVDDEPQSR